MVLTHAGTFYLEDQTVSDGINTKTNSSEYFPVEKETNNKNKTKRKWSEKRLVTIYVKATCSLSVNEG